MPRASFNAFLRIASKEIPSTMWVQTRHLDLGYFSFCVPLKIRDLNSRFIATHETGQEKYQQGIFIDIFAYDKMSSHTIKRKIDKFKAKKILRILRSKYSQIPFGHHAKLYAKLAKLCSKNTLENTLQRIITKANSYDGAYLGYGYDTINKNLILLDDIYPLQRSSFENLSALIPHKPDAILTQLYGDYMCLPPEKDRIMKHCRELVPYL